MKITKITKKEFEKMAKEEVSKQKKLMELHDKRKQLEEQVQKLNECSCDFAEKEEEIEEGLMDTFKSLEGKALAFAQNFIAQATKAGKKVEYQWFSNLIGDKFKLKKFQLDNILKNIRPLYKPENASPEYSLKGASAQMAEQLNEGGMDISPEAGVKEKKRESIFDAKPGETVIFNFNGITIKVQRQLDDLFKVTDASESGKLKDGDYLRAKGNDVLESGRKFKFAVLRAIPVDYETRELSSWKIIKN